MDYDCSGEEVQGRRKGRYRASDLWTQPGNDGGEEEAEEVTVGEELVVQEEEEETHVLVHRPLLIIANPGRLTSSSVALLPLLLLNQGFNSNQEQ